VTTLAKLRSKVPAWEARWKSRLLPRSEMRYASTPAGSSEKSSLGVTICSQSGRKTTSVCARGEPGSGRHSITRSICTPMRLYAHSRSRCVAPVVSALRHFASSQLGGSVVENRHLFISVMRIVASRDTRYSNSQKRGQPVGLVNSRVRKTRRRNDHGVMLRCGPT
jgi:hypothetical protein